MRQLICALLLALPTAGLAQELQPALSGIATFTRLDGTVLGRPVPGEPFEVTVRIENRLGNDPPAGLDLAGWFRPVEDDNLSCTEAARSFLATGRLPRGALKLNGILIGTASEDGAFTIADPEIDLASANLLGASRLAEPAASLTADIDGRRFLATLTARGEVVSIAVPTADTTVLAEGLSRPVNAFGAANGVVWVQEAGTESLTRIAQDGSRTVVATGVHGVEVSPLGDTLAVAGPAGALLRGAVSGKVLIATQAPADHAIPLADTDDTFALASLAGQRVEIRYTDAPADAILVKLPAGATRLAAGVEGRWILAHDPATDAPIMLIDVARARVVQTIATPGPVSEIAFTDRAAYLMTADQSRVGVLDLATIRPDRVAPLREVMLGQGRQVPLTGAGYLAPLWPQPGMIAIHAESYTGFIIHDYSSMGDAPPMSAIRLRGGVPRHVAGFDRSFRQVAPGVFRTTAMLPGQGQFELVTTTGIGALSFCKALPPTEGTAAAVAPGRLMAEPADAQHVRLSFRTEDGAPVRDAVFSILVSALATPWRHAVTLRSDARGQAVDLLALPNGGPVIIAAQGRDGHAFHPLVLERP
ncbi:MAG: hypothetical protein WBB85_09070 [Albidovulum sp.]|uniref:hypothetical protein n=1 Tax=Albidovulum sp. TaxID=1872424 RepID=UPI003CAF6BDC